MGDLHGLLRLPLARQLLRLRDLRGRHLRGSVGAVLGGVGIALSGTEGKPHVRLDEVPRHAHAVGEQQAEVVLGFGSTLLSALPLPRHSRRIIPRHTPAVEVQQAEADLGLGIALLGERPP